MPRPTAPISTPPSCPMASARSSMTARLEPHNVNAQKGGLPMPIKDQQRERFGEPAAGNGIMSRRIFLESALIAGAAGTVAGTAQAEPLAVPAWSKQPGSPFTPYGQPSKFESKVVRTFASAANAPGTGSARTPHQHLDGMMTPSGLHFERSHSGIPDIDPDQHRLVIHGMVRRPLAYSLENLQRYPPTSR